MDTLNIDLKYEILVLGIGNILCGDDGIGPSVVNLLQKQNWPDTVQILEVGTALLNHLEIIGSTRHLFIIDALRTGAKPGTIHRFHLEELASSLEPAITSHGIPLKQVIALAQEQTGFPVKVIIFGIEPLSLELATELSPPIKATLSQITAQIMEELNRWIVCMN